MEHRFVKIPGEQPAAAPGGGFAHQKVPDKAGHLTHQRGHLPPAGIKLLQAGKGRGRVAVGNALHQGRRLQAAGKAEGGVYPRLVHAPALSHALVQQGQRVPHAAVGQAGNQGRPLRRELYPLLSGHIQQPGGDLLGADAPEGKLLAAAFDGGGHLVDLGGGQDEHQVGRRLLQNLKQGVEGLGGEHVDLVDDVHPLFHRRRGVYRLIQDGADVVHAVVGGGVQLQHVQHGAVFNAQTGIAAVAGAAVLRRAAVYRPGQNLRAGGLSRAAGAGKEVRVGQPPGLHLALERLGDMALAHHIVKGAGPPFAVQRLIHSPFPPIAVNKMLRYTTRPHTGL